MYDDTFIKTKANTHEPSPKPGKTPVAPEVLKDIKATVTPDELRRVLLNDIMARIKAGRIKYETILMTLNGRDAWWDAWQESADLCMYLRQARMENPGNEALKDLYSTALELCAGVRLAITERDNAGS